MVLIALIAFIITPTNNPVDWRFPSIQYRYHERLATMTSEPDFNILPGDSEVSFKKGKRIEIYSFLDNSLRAIGSSKYQNYFEWGFNGKFRITRFWSIEDEFVFFSKKSHNFSLSYFDPLNDYRRKLYILKGEAAIGMASFFDLRMQKAYTEFKFRKMVFRAGRFNIRMGPGYSANFLFSGINQPLNFLYYVEAGYKNKLRFVVFNAGMPDTVEGKRVAYQRVEIHPLQKLSLGFSDAVVYTRRNLLKYINPVDFYYLIQRHSADNDDNLIAEGNITFYWPARSKFYFIFLDDDWIVTPGDNQASLYGYMLGFYSVEPFGLKNIDFRVEYSTVSPWTYAHYTHKNTWGINYTPLGHWAGNDFRHLFVEAGYWMGKNSLFTLNFEYLEHGIGDLASPWEESSMPGNISWPIKPIVFWKSLYFMIEHMHGNLTVYAKTGFSSSGKSFDPILSLFLRADLPVKLYF